MNKMYFGLVVFSVIGIICSIRTGDIMAYINKRKKKRKFKKFKYVSRLILSIEIQVISCIAIGYFLDKAYFKEFSPIATIEATIIIGIFSTIISGLRFLYKKIYCN